MSHKNGDRARFDRQRKAKMHNRTRIRELRNALPTGSAASKPTTVRNPAKKDGVL